VHLLSAYMPAEGLVLLQVAVERKENEISAAPRLLAALDLRGKIVEGDAMFTQRTLSSQIVDGGGDYIWFVKDNHAQVREAIETLFQDPLGVPDGQAARHVDKGHGRLETRRLITSGLLKGYLAWPHLEQVFQLERQAKNAQGQVLHTETVYGLTSLRRQESDARVLLDYTRDTGALRMACITGVTRPSVKMPCVQQALPWPRSWRPSIIWSSASCHDTNGPLSRKHADTTVPTLSKPFC
jgi:hypothetical protein